MINEFERQDKLRRRNYTEGAELTAEQKEKQVEEAEKKMAARERVETISKEVKNTKQQIQNIVANMQQVVRAVAYIRAQLQLAQNKAIPSVEHDQRALEALKRKLSGLYGEINDLKGALLMEERKAVQAEHQEWTAEAIQEEAGRRVQEILMSLGLENLEK